MTSYQATRYLLRGAIVLFLLALPAAAQDQAPPPAAAADGQSSKSEAARPAQQKTGLETQPEEFEQPSTRRVRFAFKKHPTLRFGNWLRMDFRVKIHSDFRFFDPEIRHQDDGRLLDLRRVRVAVEGNAFKIFEYSVERDIREEVSAGEFTSRHPWKDVFGNFRYFRKFQIQAGKFKIPFGLEQMTGSSHLDYIYRSVVSQYLTPGRDLGIMAHGHLFERGLHYQAGLFVHDGVGAEFKTYKQVGPNFQVKEHDPSGMRTFASRLTGTPLQLLPLPGTLKGIEFGANFTESALPEGESGLRGRTMAKVTFFPNMFVHGHRLRLGTDLKWTPGPFSLKGEFIRTRDQRLGQKLDGSDLPDLIARGWYVSGTWLVTGEKKTDTITPRREFLLGRGFGAVELATRYEVLRYGSADHPGKASRSSRAANILGNSDRAATFGVNWYWNRFVRVQFNASREEIEDPYRLPGYVTNQTLYWMRMWQVQFVL